MITFIIFQFKYNIEVFNIEICYKEILVCPVSVSVEKQNNDANCVLRLRQNQFINNSKCDVTLNDYYILHKIKFKMKFNFRFIF